MADELKVHHTVYNRGRDRLQGEPLVDDVDVMKSLLSDADTDLDRDEGGFFFDTIGDVFVAGFVTPKVNRDHDILFNVFETDVDVARRYDLVDLRDALRSHCIRHPESSISGTLVDPFDESTRASPERYEADGQNVSVITVLWDRLRRGETPVTATLSQVSYFMTKVHGSVGEFDFVAGVESTASRFDVQEGDLPDVDPEEVRQLYLYLQRLDEEQADIRFEDLPSLEGQYRRVLEMRMEDELESLREEFGMDGDVRRQFHEFFENEVEPRLNEQLQTFLELQEARLDPDRDLENELSDGSRFDDILLNVRGEETDPVEEELRAETDRLTTAIRIALVQSMLDRIENRLDIRAEEMIGRSSEHVDEFQRSEAYENYDRL